MQFRVTLNIKPHVRSITTRFYHYTLPLITNKKKYSYSQSKIYKQNKKKKHFIFIKIVCTEPRVLFLAFLHNWSTTHTHTKTIICGNSLYLSFCLVRFYSKCTGTFFGFRFTFWGFVFFFFLLLYFLILRVFKKQIKFDIFLVVWNGSFIYYLFINCKSKIEKHSERKTP